MSLVETWVKAHHTSLIETVLWRKVANAMQPCEAPTCNGQRLIILLLSGPVGLSRLCHWFHWQNKVTWLPWQNDGEAFHRGVGGEDSPALSWWQVFWRGVTVPAAETLPPTYFHHAMSILCFKGSRAVTECSSSSRLGAPFDSRAYINASAVSWRMT